MKTKYLTRALLAAGLAFLAGFASVQAATLSIYRSDTGEIKAALTAADGSVNGFIGVGSLSPTSAALFDVGANPASETAYLESLIPVPSGSLATGVTTEMSGGEEYSGIAINSQYFSFKLGDWNSGKGGTVFFKNMTSGPIMVDYSALGQGVGLSHVTQYVPIPAAAYLFGSALIGLAGIGYRRRS